MGTEQCVLGGHQTLRRMPNAPEDTYKPDSKKGDEEIYSCCRAPRKWVLSDQEGAEFP